MKPKRIDATIGEIPGLEQLTLIDDYLEAALARAAALPGYAGVVAEVPQSRCGTSPVAAALAARPTAG